MLTLFAFINMILLFVTMLGSGSVALWSVLGIGLFNSIMWSEYLYPVDQRPEAIHQLRLFLAGDDDRWWGDHSDRTGPIG
jgi:hypothetical protein